MREQEKPKRTADHEWLAVSSIIRRLAELPDDAARKRVIRYVVDRYPDLLPKAEPSK